MPKSYILLFGHFGRHGHYATQIYFFSKGKAGTRRSSTKTCEGYLVFSITSTESHTGLNKNEKKIMEF